MLTKALINQVEGTVDYAATGNTLFTLLELVHIAYQLIFQTGMFTNDCNQCKRRDPDDKTWTEFMIFFATVHQELRESQATTAGAGHHAANIVDNQAANQVYRQENIDAILNLSTATVSDCVLVATLAIKNSNLFNVLTLSSNNLVTAIQDVALLTGTIVELCRKTGNQSPATAPEVEWEKGTTVGRAGMHASTPVAISQALRLATRKGKPDPRSSAAPPIISQDNEHR